MLVTRESRIGPRRQPDPSKKRKAHFMNSRVCLQRRVLSLALVMATSLGPALSQTTVLITEFTVPTADSFPYGITAGPDGALGFTDNNANKIGGITPKGGITEYIVAPPPP